MNNGPYTVTGVLHDGLVYKVRHDATGLVSNVFVGRLIPSESRLDDGLQIKFPAPLNQDNTEPPSAVCREVADDGAEHKEMLEEESHKMRTLFVTLRTRKTSGNHYKCLTQLPRSLQLKEAGNPQKSGVDALGRRTSKDPSNQMSLICGRSSQTLLKEESGDILRKALGISLW